MTRKIKMLTFSFCLVISAIFLTGCNKEVFDTNRTFDTAIITRSDGEQTVKIKQWRDYADGEQLQLTLQNGAVILVNSNRIILVNSENGNFN